MVSFLHSSYPSAWPSVSPGSSREAQPIPVNTRALVKISAGGLWFSSDSFIKSLLIVIFSVPFAHLQNPVSSIKCSPARVVLIYLKNMEVCLEAPDQTCQQVCPSQAVYITVLFYFAQIYFNLHRCFPVAVVPISYWVVRFQQICDAASIPEEHFRVNGRIGHRGRVHV